MTQEEILRARMMGNPENPPPYSGDTQLWAEDLDNYLRRRMERLESEIRKAGDKIEVEGRKIRRMEALINERGNGTTSTGTES